MICLMYFLDLVFNRRINLMLRGSRSTNESIEKETKNLDP